MSGSECDAVAVSEPRDAPDTIAVEADDGALTYARAARARARAAVESARGASGSRSRCRRAWTSPSPCTPACSRAPPRCPVDLREPIPRLAGADDRDRRARSTARRPARRGRAARAAPDLVRAGPRRPHLGHHRHAAAGRAHARPDPPQRARLRRRARARPRRALALPAAAQPRRRADGPVAVGDLRDDRRARPGRPRRRHDRLARPDPARAAARPRAARRRCAS